MKKILILTITIIMLFCNTINVFANSETCYVNATALNCRTQPNMNGAIITTFKKGKELQIINTNGSWWQVYDGEIKGWCYGSYLTIKNVSNSSLEDYEIVENNNNGTYLGNFKVSYYTCSSSENGGWNITAKGQKLTDVVGVCIAADPKVIPYYSKVYIENVGVRTVLDCGGAIKGNKIDVLVRNNSDIPSCGVHYSNVYLIN